MTYPHGQTVAPKPSIVGLAESEFDPEAAAKTFHGIITGGRSGGVGRGQNKNTIIINLVTQHDSRQRQIIRTKYKELFDDKDLAIELRKNFGGNFSKTVYGLMLHPAEFLAEQVHASVEGAGTDERRLIPLLITRTNAEFDEMKVYYRQKFGKEMEQEVGDDVSWHFRELLLAIMKGTREEYDDVEPERIRADAKTLYGVREADLGSREEEFKKIFTNRAPPHLARVIQAYNQISGGRLTIEDTISKVFFGDLKNAYLALVKRSQSIVTYNTQRLQKCMAGLGTDDDTLMEILISRSEIDLTDIAQCYQAMYKKSLVKAVSGDTSGHYRTLLTGLIEGNKN